MDREQLQAGDGVYSPWSSSALANYQSRCTILRKDHGVNRQTVRSSIHPVRSIPFQCFPAHTLFEIFFQFDHGIWQLNNVSFNRQDSSMAAGDPASKWAWDAYSGGEQVQPLV